jgi:aryl-alcohol dehydrogenase-like predicted oxidoreductase
VVTAGGRPARPSLGERSTTLGKQNPSTDSAGRPLFLDSDQGTVDAVQRIAEARGIAMAQVALAWVLHHPVVSAPIIGVTRPRHLTDAVAALDVSLTDDELFALEEHYTPRQPTHYGSKSGY